VCGALALLFWALALPARADGEYDPYRIPREQFSAQVSRVALRPLRLPDGTPDAERLRAELEGLIAAELEKRGYTVVSSQVFAETWRRFARDLGGVYDPVSGMPDAQKYLLAQQHTVRELERTQKVDAVLSPSIALDAIPAYIGFWYWEAAGTPIRWQGKDLASAVNQQPQRVEGPYLRLLIHDNAQVLLYDAQIALAWSRVYVGGGYEEVPAGEIYGSRERNQKTVEKLLGLLVDRTSGAPAHAN
jgi:hypothetical protein